MLYIFAVIALVILIYGPQWWVRHVIRKHNGHVEQMPGTGAELARHLIERFELEGVVVEKTSKDQDYYSPGELKVGLSPEVYDGKSISAVAIAAHEVGHAIQYTRGETVSKLRGRYTRMASIAQGLGVVILMLAPVLGAILKVPVVLFLTIAAGALVMLSSVLFHALILPEEFDASFVKALPILEEGYLPQEALPAARQVLKACAYTYVASALADLLRVWRWLAILR